MTRITGIAHFTFHDGMADRFLELAEECRRIVDTLDPGTTRYDIYLAPDRSGAVVIEEYVDVAAAFAHQDNIGEELNQAIIATASEVHGELLGDLPPELVNDLGDGPVRPFLGIPR